MAPRSLAGRSPDLLFLHPRSMYNSRKYNIPTNKYGVKAGQDQQFWEEHGWIIEQDPRGWFQWCGCSGGGGEI